MELLRVNYKETLHFPEPVVGILGQFDGLHIGHVQLIQTAIRIGKENNQKVAVMTFDPHPDFVLKKRENLGYLTPLPQKLKLLEELGVDYVVLIHFDLDLSQLLPEQFHSQFLSDVTTVVVGSDYRYGYRGSGNTETLKADNRNVVAFEVIKDENEKIGSNTIRGLLMEGRVEEIKRLLNRSYTITGIVGHGSKIGRTMGIRTANVELSEEYQVLKKGVYIVHVTIEGSLVHGVCNIGTNPTINTLEKMRLEVHLLNFEQDIYGKEITIEFLQRIRDELKFDSKEELIAQIHDDIRKTVEYFAEASK